MPRDSDRVLRRARGLPTGDVAAARGRHVAGAAHGRARAHHHAAGVDGPQLHGDPAPGRYPAALPAGPGGVARGTEESRCAALDWRPELPSWPVLGSFTVAIAVCDGLLLAEESWRCWRAARVGGRVLVLQD